MLGAYQPGTLVPVPQLCAIDLFAGAGGLSLGLGAAGWDIVAAVERDVDAASTYQRYHPAAQVYQQDIEQLELGQYHGQLELVAGGPPCQPFSVGGLRRGQHDGRDGIPQFVRALRQISPPLFLLENVPELAGTRHHQYFTEMLAQLAQLGYNLSWTVLQAADLGVPQLRRRLFVAGSRAGLGQLGALPRPAGTPPRVPAGTVIGLAPQGSPNPAVITYARRPSLRPNPYHGHLFNGGGRPIDLAAPAPTMLASMGGNKTPWVDTQDIVPRYHAWLAAGGTPRHGLVPGARRITTLEAALLQTFPAGTVFAGPPSSQYRQIGNAVPPLLAHHLGTWLRQQLRDRAA
jgi:DNA (cytosine-5)-methyltransferase 1